MGVVTRKCPEDTFKCELGQCIPTSWICDGQPDCFHLEDELGCSKFESYSCHGQDFSGSRAGWSE